MKSTDSFKNTIKAYLDKRAAEDVLFAFTYAKEGKNLDDCITYILNSVKNSGCYGFTDDEIFGMAVHYYDEDKINIGKSIKCENVVVNHKVELTEEEKAQARKKALDDLVEEERKKLTQKPAKPTQKQESHDGQISLF